MANFSAGKISASVRCGERRSDRAGSGSGFHDVGTTERANRGAWCRGTEVDATGCRAKGSAIGDVLAHGKTVATDTHDRRDGFHGGRHRESHDRAQPELHRQNRG